MNLISKLVNQKEPKQNTKNKKKKKTGKYKWQTINKLLEVTNVSIE